MSRTESMAKAWERTGTIPGQRYRVFVELDPKPIPVRDLDWNAWVDGDEERGTETGATAAEALRSLADRLEMDELDAAEISG